MNIICAPSPGLKSQNTYPRGDGIKEGHEGQVEVSQREEGRILQMCKRQVVPNENHMKNYVLKLSFIFPTNQGS